MLYQEALPNFFFYLKSVVWLQLETHVKVSHYVRKAKSACLRGNRCLCGVPIFIWVLVNTCVVVIEMVPIFMGYLFSYYPGTLKLGK